MMRQLIIDALTAEMARQNEAHNWEGGWPGDGERYFANGAGIDLGALADEVIRVVVLEAIAGDGGAPVIEMPARLSAEMMERITKALEEAKGSDKPILLEGGLRWVGRMPRKKS